MGQIDAFSEHIHDDDFDDDYDFGDDVSYDDDLDELSGRVLDFTYQLDVGDRQISFILFSLQSSGIALQFLEESLVLHDSQGNDLWIDQILRSLPLSMLRSPTAF